VGGTKTFVMEVIFEPIGEIMGMGGPWSSKVYVNGIQLEGNYIEQQKVYNIEKKLVCLVKITLYKVLFIEKIAFKIMILNINSQREYISKKQFDYLFIENFVGDDITYYESFHDKSKAVKNTLRFDDRNFTIV
jgi:hypothetical protein